MELEGSFPCSREPSIGTYSSRMNPVYTYFLKGCYSIIFPFVRATYPAHTILDFVTLIISDEYKL